MPTCLRRLVTTAAITILCVPLPLAAQTPSLDEALSHVATYLRDYIPRFANVVSAEDYEQRITVRAGGGGTITSSGNVVGGTSGTTIQTWHLKSEVLLVRYPLGQLDWMWFRDVAEADGKRLAHEPDRLIKLFAAPDAEATTLAARIAYEGFRYNLGGATVPATNPLLVVALMQSHYQPRLRFKLGGTERSLGANVRSIRLEEREEAEGASGSSQKDRQKLPALLGEVGRVRGTVWVDVVTGQIRKTEARIGELAKETTTTTTFMLDERLALLVPKEMRTSWRYTGGSGPVAGIARYSNFKRFETSTDTPVVRVPK
jgi:hypothetical protein